MANISFPSSPSLNDEHVTQGQTFKYDGKRWKKLNVEISASSTTESLIKSTLASAASDISYNSSTGEVSVNSVGGYSLSVVTQLPGTPDGNTIYFVTA